MCAKKSSSPRIPSNSSDSARLGLVVSERNYPRMFKSPVMPIDVDSSDESLARCLTVDVKDWPIQASYEEQLRSQMLDLSALASTSTDGSDDLLFESENVDVPSVEVVYDGSRFERLDAAFEARCVDQMNAARAASVASLSKDVETAPFVPPSDSSSAPSPAPAD